MLDKSSANLTRRLEEIGLTEKEAKVYLTALRLGPANVLKLAAGAKLSRTSLYPVLESLRESGLMTTSISGMKRLFAAEPPSRLEAIIDAKRALVHSILPDLEATRKLTSAGDRIKEYSGRQAVRTAYEELLAGTRPHDDYFVCTELEKWMSLDPGFFTEFRKQRDRMLLNLQFLVTDSATTRAFKEASKGRAEVRMLPKGSVLETNVVIVPQRVLIHRLTNPVSAVVLTDPSIVALHRQFHQLIWNGLSPGGPRGAS